MMKTTDTFRLLLLTAVMLLTSLTVQAQNSLIRRNTTTTTTKHTKTRNQTRPVKPSKPTTGTISITSTPTDAAVKIDGEYMGTTPLILKNRKKGTYQVTVSYEGYESQTRNTTVTTGHTETVSVTLKKRHAQQQRHIAIQQPEQAQQQVDTLQPPQTQQYVATQQSEQTQRKFDTLQHSPIQQPTLTQQRTKQQPVQKPLEITTSDLSKTFTVHGVSFKMIKVEGGTFTMGKTAEQDIEKFKDEKPAHNVTLSSYYIGETEVTQELWIAVMGSNPSNKQGRNLPVEQVSWEDCQKFVRELNRITGKNFRLPTEAEWEFAARGGNKTTGCKYSGSNSIEEVAWYINNSSSSTHDVKTKAPNELGIYDMSGNVWEWCQDKYGKYSSSSQINPTGVSSGSNRVFRGGGWRNSVALSRVSTRLNGTPSIRFISLGLRLAL